MKGKFGDKLHEFIQFNLSSELLSETFLLLFLNEKCSELPETLIRKYLNFSFFQWGEEQPIQAFVGMGSEGLHRFEWKFVRLVWGLLDHSITLPELGNSNQLTKEP